MSLLKTYSDGHYWSVDGSPKGMLKQTPSSHPAFVSDGELTEIQLHSVESINDLHRHQSEQKAGGRPPLRPFPLSSNGNVSTPVLRTTARQICGPSQEALKYYPHILLVAGLSILITTLVVILFVVVKQASTVSSLSELLLQHQGHMHEMSELKHKLQLLERNLTSTGR